MQHSLLLAVLSTAALQAAPIPLELARPDGKPGDASKPVKVYVLAGQSNMVGMSAIKGARPPYPSIYLSADPAVIEGTVPTPFSPCKCRAMRGILPEAEKANS